MNNNTNHIKLVQNVDGEPMTTSQIIADGSGNASAAGLIEAIGVAKSSRPSRRGNRNVVWRRA